MFDVAFIGMPSEVETMRRRWLGWEVKRYGYKAGMLNPGMTMTTIWTDIDEWMQIS